MNIFNNFEPPPPLDKLQHLDHPLKYEYWWMKRPAFIEEIGFTREHIPELIELSKVWAYRTIWPDDLNDLTVFAPIHAWRVLGYLKASDAVEPLIGILNRLDENGDDWFLEELPWVFTLIGPEAIPYLKAFAVDNRNRMFSRIASWSSLTGLAQRYPEKRDEVVAAMSDDLAKFEMNSPGYNGLLICELLDLKAVESGELIEQAFAGDNVDDLILSFDDVKQELGVWGTPLSTDEYLENFMSKSGKGLTSRKSESSLKDTGSKETGSEEKQNQKSKSRNKKRKLR